jgi:hypothetical protein
VYFVPERGWLFTADLLVSTRPKMARFDEDVLQNLRSLRLICDTLDVGTVFCAHKGAVKHGGRALRERLTWLQGVQEKGRELYVQRGQPLAHITTALLGREDFLQMVSRGDFSRINLMAGLLADVIRPEDAALVPTPKHADVRNEVYWKRHGHS